MEHCDFWRQDDKAENCDLISSACRCGGSDEHCCIKGQSIADAVRQEERLTLDEFANRAQRRRHGLEQAS